MASQSIATAIKPAILAKIALRAAACNPRLFSSLLKARKSPPATLRAQARYYSEEVHDHFRDPRNVGSLDSSDPAVGTAIVGKASCGDVIKLQVRVKDDVIEDVKFKAFGCGSAIASSSFASELIKGKTCDEALRVKNVDIANHLSLPPVKIHCSLLAEDAVRHAIHNFRMKNRPRDPPNEAGDPPNVDREG